MHNQRSDDLEATERAVLTMLLDPDARGLWSTEEVAREVGDPLAATDALDSLYGAGLLHRLGGFVFPTRPAVRGAELAG